MSFIETLRSVRVGPFALFDFALAYAGIYLIAPLLSRMFHVVKLDIPRSSWLWFTLPISVVVHLAIGTITPFTRMAIDPQGGYLIKLLLGAMLYLGARNIKIKSSARK